MSYEERYSPKKYIVPPPTMQRLADYFVVVGYREVHGSGCGVLLQRFPEKDWPDQPFCNDIAVFWQPSGWVLSSEKKEPKFFMIVLTKEDGSKGYCGCLTFYEAVDTTPSRGYDDDEDDTGEDSSLLQSYSSSSLTRMFAPKVLCLVSRHNHPDTFKNCLGTIYTVFAEGISIPLETIVGTLLGHVHVPPPGGPQIRFSIGGGDRQALQPPASPSIPVTNTSVALLFQQLGINNVLTLFCAAMLEQKILFHSKSSTRLYEACNSLIALMYPFRWLHTVIPLLPVSLAVVTDTPTPFLIGIQSEGREVITDKLLDVIQVDLDGGSIVVPKAVEKMYSSSSNNGEIKSLTEIFCNSMPRFPDSLWNHVFQSLTMVLHPELTSCDFAFPPLAVKASMSFQLDKEIRAIFMKFIAQIFQGYRSCLVIIRVHPTPVITFNAAKFLAQRGLGDNQFVVHFLRSQCFTNFVSERGIPWRPNDIWDDLYHNLLEQVKLEAKDPKLAMIYIQELAEHLARNETPNSQPYVPKIVKPPEGAHSKLLTPVFPTLNSDIIDQLLSEGSSKQQLARYNSASLVNQPKVVPFGPKVTELLNPSKPVADNAVRRLEVLRTCVTNIFDNKITEARKSIHAVTRSLKNEFVKLALCDELAKHVTGNKAILEPPQFDLVVKLIHCALKETSESDEHGVAAKLLPLATSFCRKLNTGIMMFVYSCIQDHPVWKNQQFWETAFYADVQIDIKALYAPRTDSLFNNSLYNNNSMISSSDKPKENISSNNVFNKPSECTALDIAAEQLRLAATLDPEKVKQLGDNEQSTMYSQAIHYANRMVFMLVPLDTPPARKHKDSNHLHIADNVSNITSVAESDSIGGESAFEEHDLMLDSGTSVVRFITRFIDTVCGEGGVSLEKIKILHTMVPGVVDMHVETLEGVSRESKRLPPVQKAKIPSPAFLPGEDLVMESLRVYLLSDGREVGETVGGIGVDGVTNHNKSPLPAEGALFLTNYRLVFKGTPCDQSVSLQTVIRSFPLTSVTKEKRFAVPYVAQFDQKLQDGMQIRSATFQLMKLAFDEDVSSENIEIFRKILHRLRFPTDIFPYFAFVGQTANTMIQIHHGVKDKNTTLRSITRKAIMMTARKVGVKSKKSNRQKYVLGSWPTGGTLPASTRYHTGGGNGSPIHSSPPSRDMQDLDEISMGSTGSLSTVSDEEYPHTSPSTTSTLPSPTSDAKTMEKILERSYCNDWKRLKLGLVSRSVPSSTAASILYKAESFRCSHVNYSYTVCHSYPATVIVPNSISDESIKKLSVLFSCARFPVITYRHSQTKGLLLRASALNNKGIASRVFGTTQKSQGIQSDVGAHLEYETFIRAVVNATPTSSNNNPNLGALIALSIPAAQQNLPQITPEVNRKVKASPFAKAMDTLRYTGTSGGKGIKSYTSWVQPKPKKGPSSTIAPHFKSVAKLPEIDPVVGDTIHKTHLYILVDKSKAKSMKPDTNSKVEYVSVISPPDPTKIRASFKLALRACVPSALPSDPEESFLRAFESSEWLGHISNLMKLSGTVVDLIDCYGGSVMLCLGDGFDLTTQMTALAELCLDPYYRTMEGFRTLVEKEWLAFGHKFSERNNMTGYDGYKSTHMITPIFIMFLDAVHQIHKQFPLTFEFNEFYLKFLAYHSISARFRTFLLDSEFERVSCGFMAADDKRSSLPRPYKGVDTGSDDETIYMSKQVGSNSHQHHLGQSVFDYIEKIHSKQTIFYNFLYSKDSELTVLRPFSSLSNLEIWDYFTWEKLGVGSSFELELVSDDVNEEDSTIPLSSDDNRRIISAENDVVENLFPDVFTFTLQEVNKLESKSGLLPQKWKQLSEKSEYMLSNGDDNKYCSHESLYSNTQLVRGFGEAIHKRNTVDVLLRARLGKSADLSAVVHAHSLERHTFTNLANCDTCTSILLGKTGFQCKDCNVKCHEKCVEGLPKCPGKYGEAQEDEDSSQMGTVISNNDNIPVGGGPKLSVPSVQQQKNYYQFQSNISENRTHEGFLYKRGALLKGWKQRWFVLDSTKHQLRYYDAMEDSNYKGFIDLSEVSSVCMALPAPGAPKHSDDKSFFDIRTIKRCYNFCAKDAREAQDWIEKIQACL